MGRCKQVSVNASADGRKKLKVRVDEGQKYRACSDLLDSKIEGLKKKKK